MRDESKSEAAVKAKEKIQRMAEYENDVEMKDVAEAVKKTRKQSSSSPDPPRWTSCSPSVGSVGCRSDPWRRTGTQLSETAARAPSGSLRSPAGSRAWWRPRPGTARGPSASRQRPRLRPRKGGPWRPDAGRTASEPRGKERDGEVLRRTASEPRGKERWGSVAANRL